MFDPLGRPTRTVTDSSYQFFHTHLQSETWTFRIHEDYNICNEIIIEEDYKNGLFKE